MPTTPSSAAVSSRGGGRPRPANANHGKDDNNDDDDDSFSSDSDDEFLTLHRGDNNADGTGAGGGGSAADREALVRKKLLESFYGKSAIDAGPSNTTTTTTTRRRLSGVDTDSRDSSSDEDDDDDHYHHDPTNAAPDPLRAEDLDSPHFNATAHRQKHVLNAGVHALLETEEGLACQVRTLDSSLQTLVYENYSRFIEATDAIRNIAVNVETNHSNLSKLQDQMSHAAEASRAVETTVGPLRDQVVEKLRLKRLLQRLDTLLKLPTTLRQQIQAGKYRLATQSYVSAYSILSKHSAGFESLQRIESDCHEIMTQLLKDVRHKLVHWTGGVVPSSLQRNQSSAGSDNVYYNDDDDDDDDDDGYKKEQEEKDEELTKVVDGEDDDDDYGPLPDPPQSIAEIMECAGTPALILAAQQQPPPAPSDGAPADTVPVATTSNKWLDPRLTLDDCQEMALNASLRFLERILDTHHIELQEEHLLMSTPADTSKNNNSSNARGGFPDPTSLISDADPQGANATTGTTLSLIPTTVLDSILETSTMYTMSFVNDDNANDDSGRVSKGDGSAANERLAQFVSTAFTNFLQHVRGELLEQALLQHQQANQARAAAQKAHKSSQIKKAATAALHKKTRSEDAAEGAEILRLAAAEEKAEAESDQYEEHIATAMATLLLSVRQLASGLTMVPKAAIAPALASGLVDQTTGLTEAMVRRRVDQKFYTLRLRVIEDCLAPFCQAVKDLSNEDEETKEEQPPPLLGAVQLASVALSDSLQLVDDTVRSILATLDEDGRGGAGKSATGDEDNASDDAEDDDSMLREAVEQSTKRFAKWLASAMEMLAGYESSTDPKSMLQAKIVRADDYREDEGLRPTSSYGGESSMLPTHTGPGNVTTHIVVDDTSVTTAENSGDSSVDEALMELLHCAEPTLYIVLAIAEMCRVAERSVMDNIQQSITTHGGGGPTSATGTGPGGVKGRKSTAGSRGDDLFAGDENQKSSRAANNPIARRFRLAASRVLSLYAMNRGHEAATLLCSKLADLSYKPGNDGPSVDAPRPVVFQVLELVKATSLDCADLFGGNRRAGPIPERLEDEYASLTASRMNSASNNRSGLAFDVERMFAEKVIVYPHPSEIADFQRNAVVALLFKVAFKAWSEYARLLQFSVQGFRQIKVDVEFFKWYLPHYIKDETLSDGSNARSTLTSLLTEIVQTSKERCVREVEGLYQDVDETNQARSIIRRYLSSQQDGGSPSFCIADE